LKTRISSALSPAKHITGGSRSDPTLWEPYII
jgi:hypothetical protein